jgi:hypothetical protein
MNEEIKKRLYRHNKFKWKIVKKGEEEPIYYCGKIMTFRNKVTMRDFFEKVKKNRFDEEIEWAEI